MTEKARNEKTRKTRDEDRVGLGPQKLRTDGSQTTDGDDVLEMHRELGEAPGNLGEHLEGQADDRL